MSSLFTGAIDDAAVFPPGSSPLDAAVLSHRVWRSGPIASYLGPLLVPADRIRDLIPLLTSDPIAIGIIGAAGGVHDLIGAARSLQGNAGVRVTGVELALPAEERDAGPTVIALSALLADGMTVTIEVGRVHPVDVLESLAGLPELAAGKLRAKIRTGGVTVDAWPGFAELAQWIHTAVGLGVPLKFTAGLHHAVVVTEAIELPHHGVLNIIAAVDAAHRGAGRSTIAAILADPDVADLVGSFDVARTAAVRKVFLSFGCCGVTEPLAELAALALIPPITEAIPA